MARDEIKALKRDAEKLVEAIGVFENTVQKSTANLHDFLMTPPWERSRIMSQDDLTAERISYKKALLNPLLQMRADCERVVAQIADEQTSGPEFDRGQRFCATLAYRVMERFSERPITGNPEGPYNIIASILYEALTGRREIDLRRHCDWVRTHPPPVP